MKYNVAVVHRYDAAAVRTRFITKECARNERGDTVGAVSRGVNMATKKTPLADVREGMVTSEQVFSDNGRKLIERGVTITRDMLRLLKTYYVDYVPIHEDDPSEAKEEEPAKAQGPVIEENGKRIFRIDSKRAKERHSLSIERTAKLFENVKETNELPIADARETVEGLVTEVLGNPQAFSNLSILRMKDEYTYVHSVDVAVLATLVATEMQMDKKDIFDLSLAGILHDVGKMLVPDEVLNKPGKFTPPEMEQMKKHAFLGYKILKKENVPEEVADYVLEHHEWVNGKGYPFGKRDIYLHTQSKILAVCDVFNALVTQRSYKNPIPAYKAVRILASEAGTHLDQNIVRVFQRIIGVYPNGTAVRLSDGSVARVVEQNSSLPMRPVLGMVQTKDGRPEAPTAVNLQERKDLFIKEIVPLQQGTGKG